MRASRTGPGVERISCDRHRELAMTGVICWVGSWLNSVPSRKRIICHSKTQCQGLDTATEQLLLPPSVARAV